jgi:ankyrin repeat protein
MQACCSSRESEALLQAQDLYGRTPLHYCLLYEAHSIARMLLRRGADKSITDCVGQTALDVAIQRGRMQDEELLVLLSPS